ncbi:MAG TPA: hypothetical protein PKA83_14960 [Pirellulaceae bacterium]|nr:hypothetical protein [Pirellulaceae bacterium]HMO15421.1 hypothetical protein [Pirellulaceae bacterium]
MPAITCASVRWLRTPVLARIVFSMFVFVCHRSSYSILFLAKTGPLGSNVLAPAVQRQPIAIISSMVTAIANQMWRGFGFHLGTPGGKRNISLANTSSRSDCTSDFRCTAFAMQDLNLE